MIGVEWAHEVRSAGEVAANRTSVPGQFERVRERRHCRSAADGRPQVDGKALASHR